MCLFAARGAIWREIARRFWVALKVILAGIYAQGAQPAVQNTGQADNRGSVGRGQRMSKGSKDT